MKNSNDIKSQFTVFEKYPHLIYMDSGATSLKPKRVIDKMMEYYNDYPGTVHRGVYQLSYLATAEFEASRSKTQKFINAQSEAEIIFTKGTTQSLNFVAKALADFVTMDDEIIVSDVEHHANLVPWQVLCQEKKAHLIIVKADANGQVSADDIIDRITDQTKIVSIAHVSNVTGMEVDIAKIGANKKNAIFVVDAAQSIPHMAVDVQATNVDFLAWSAHKMFGPTGLGILYINSKWHHQIKPFEYGGSMVDQVNCQTATYKDAPEKFEAGTPAIAEVIAFGEAIEFINDFGYTNIESHCRRLHKYFCEQVKAHVPELKIYNQGSEIGIITFNVADIHPHDMTSIYDQHGIAVRAGHHCNQTTMQKYNVNATLRVSLSIYNSESDIDSFIKATQTGIELFGG